MYFEGFKKLHSFFTHPCIRIPNRNNLNREKQNLAQFESTVAEKAWHIRAIRVMKDKPAEGRRCH